MEPEFAPTVEMIKKSIENFIEKNLTKSSYSNEEVKSLLLKAWMESCAHFKNYIDEVLTVKKLRCDSQVDQIKAKLFDLGVEKVLVDRKQYLENLLNNTEDEEEREIVYLLYKETLKDMESFDIEADK
jgi:hypothetical protein